MFRATDLVVIKNYYIESSEFLCAFGLAVTLTDVSAVIPTNFQP